MTAHSLKEVKAQFQRQGIYHTDNELARMMRSYLPDYVRDVYDPTCGRGALLAEFAANVPKYGQELEQAFMDDCYDRLENFTGAVGDTLAAPAFTDRKFHAIVANYPFSIPWTPKVDERFESAPTIPTKSRADYAFILHCLHYLADDGTAAIMAFPGVLYRQQREGIIREWLVKQNYVDRVAHIPGGYFEDTTVAVCVLVLKKRRDTTDIIFEDWENGFCVKASQDEVTKNRFNLAVSTYTSDALAVNERDDIDIVALNDDIRRLAVNYLRRALEIELMLTVIDRSRPPISEMLNELQAVIDEARKAAERTEI